MRRFIIAAALLVTCAVPAWAQGIKLEFHNGRVTLNAENVPLRTILNAWAQQGSTRIVNGDRIPGGLVTLALNDVPERQALDAILRNASGYIAGPRTPGQPGASSYASILILPVSTAAAAAPPPPQAAPQPAFPFARPIQRVAPPPDSDDDPVNDIPPVDDGAAGPQRPGAPQRFFNRGQRQDGTPQRPPIRNTTPNDDDDTPPPAPSTTPTPANPFGVNVGSSQPGVISPVPTPNPQQPRPRPDPEP